MHICICRYMEKNNKRKLNIAVAILLGNIICRNIIWEIFYASVASEEGRKETQRKRSNFGINRERQWEIRGLQ